jgi:hypothetical protein
MNHFIKLVKCVSLFIYDVDKEKSHKQQGLRNKAQAATSDLTASLSSRFILSVGILIVGLYGYENDENNNN